MITLEAEQKKKLLPELNAPELTTSHTVLPQEAQPSLFKLRPPGADRGIETGKLVGDAYDKGGFPSAAGTFLRRVPGDIAVGAKEMLVDPINNVISPWVNATADIGKTVLTGKINSFDEKPRLLNNINQPNINKPVDTPVISNNKESVVLPLQPHKINEPTNALRDQELGKMTSSAELLADGGQKNTLAIGGNTLSYNLSADDLNIKRNLDALNTKVASMNPSDITPEQNKQIRELRQQAGHLRGGSNKDPFDNNQTNTLALRSLGQPVKAKVGNLDITYDGNIPTNEIQDNVKEFKLQHHGTIEAKKENYARSLPGINSDSQTTTAPQPPRTGGMSPNERSDAIDEYKAQLAHHSQSENNRISELSTKSENALRDAQIKAMKIPINPVEQLTAQQRTDARNDAFSAFQNEQKNNPGLTLNSSDWLRDSPYSDLFPEYSYKKSPDDVMNEFKKDPTVWQRFQKYSPEQQQALIKQQRLR